MNTPPEIGTMVRYVLPNGHVRPGVVVENYVENECIGPLAELHKRRNEICIRIFLHPDDHYVFASWKGKETMAVYAAYSAEATPATWHR